MIFIYMLAVLAMAAGCRGVSVDCRQVDCYRPVVCCMGGCDDGFDPTPPPPASPEECCACPGRSHADDCPPQSKCYRQWQAAGKKSLDPPESDLPVKVTLELRKDEKDLIAELTFLNAAAEPYPVEQHNVKATGANYFDVRCKGVTLKYIGRFKKVDGNARVVLSPHEPVKQEIRIGKLYDFSPGRHDCTIQYRASHAGPATGGKIHRLWSNIAKFSYSP